jgi:hypothetical protein
MDDHIRHLIDKGAVIDTINRLFVAVDDRDWAGTRECLAPQVVMDVSSMTGEAPATLASEEIIQSWTNGLEPMEAVHHQSGNFRVAVIGSEADAFCYATAFHYLTHPSGENTRRFVGSYDFHLTKQDAAWVIDRFKYNLKFIDGNVDLEGSS